MKKYKITKINEMITSQGVKGNLRRPGIKMLALKKQKSKIMPYLAKKGEKKTCYNCQWGHEINDRYQKCMNVRVYRIITHGADTCIEWNKEYKDVKEKPLKDIG